MKMPTSHLQFCSHFIFRFGTKPGGALEFIPGSVLRDHLWWDEWSYGVLWIKTRLAECKTYALLYGPHGHSFKEMTVFLSLPQLIRAFGY